MQIPYIFVFIEKQYREIFSFFNSSKFIKINISEIYRNPIFSEITTREISRFLYANININGNV